MELRSGDTAEERSRTKYVKATRPSTGSDAATSSRARNRKSGPSTTSSVGRRTSPSRHQMEAQSSSSCSNNEHCSKNKSLSQHESAAVHDNTNGQVMGVPANSSPATSASSAHNRQRDVLVYGFFSVWLCSVV